MPDVTAEIADPIDVSGLPASVTANTPQADNTDPISVYGLPANVLTPEPTPSPNPDSVRVRVLDENGVFICHLPHPYGIRWLDEFNTAGAGSVDVRRFDDLETSRPGVWAAGNQLVIAVGTIDVFRLILDSEPGYRVDKDTSERVDTRAGTGALGVLNSGMVIPEYGWRPEATETRSFDYGSNPNSGGWLVASEWKNPVGKKVRKSWRWTYKKRRLPKGWPERNAEWLWWKNPDTTNVPNEICYFRSSFTLDDPSRVKFWVCGDDTLEFQVDGEVRLTTGGGDWRRTSTLVLNLAAGNHYVAAKVANAKPSAGANNRSGFICAIGVVDREGDVVNWVKRTSSTSMTWHVRRQRSGPPGWFAAQILRQLVQEQKDRGCAGHAGVSFGFTTRIDSAQVSWTAKQDLALTVGTLGLDYVQQLVETGIDVAMSPSLQLNAWRKRGVDRSSTVRLDQAVEETAAQANGIRNAAFARARTGWVGRSNSASIAAVGRRETMITLGSSRSQVQTSASIGAMLPDLTNPDQTIEVSLSGISGPQPYRHFNVGDWVAYRASGYTTRVRYRVMSVAGEVTEAGHPNWTVQLYRD